MISTKRVSLLIKTVIIVFFLLSISVSTLSAGVIPVRDVFIDEEMDSSDIQSISGDKKSIRSRVVSLNTALLCELENEAFNYINNGISLNKEKGAVQAYPSLLLNLFDDVNLRARIDKIEKAYLSGYSYVGKIEGIPDSEVIMVISGDIMSGDIRVGGHLYGVRFLSGGKHIIREIDQSKFGEELPPLVVPSYLYENQPGGYIQSENPSLMAGPTIDVMVLYTGAARAAAGGTSAMVSTINLAVSETNTGYSNSGVSQRISLVHTAEVSYDESGFDWYSCLDRLQDSGDGFMDEIHTLRNTYGADEVVLIVEDGGYCGLGYMMTTVSSSFSSYGFCLVSRGCATGYYSFAHEMGHNMGCHHDRANASGQASYDYAYGYQAPDQSFRTIMAYNCSPSCPRVNYWSNPNKTYGGLVMGVVQGDPNAADNHLALNNTASTVAAFRPTASISPSITVLQPNGGEFLEVGSSYSIQWSTGGTVGNVKIEYSSNNGGSWNTITASTSNDGSYSWSVPDVESSNCKVRISEASDGSPVDTSNAVFSITSNLPTITVLQPNGGETLKVGALTSIQWSSSGGVGNVKIEYTTNNGGSWRTVISSTSNSGSYSWSVPNTTSTSCKVRISQVSGGVPTDTSDSVFTISSTAPSSSITVTYPNGGEILSVGSTYNIQWSSSGSVGNVKIEYTVNNGSSWNVIANSLSNSGKYAWLVPNQPSALCKVRISQASGSTPSDTSNAVFTIYQPKPPRISLNHTQLSIGALTSGEVTNPQGLIIKNAGEGSLVWSVSTDAAWLQCTPASGSGSGIIMVSANVSGLSVGAYSGTITVNAPGADNSPVIVPVSLNVYNPGATVVPFGEISTPVDGSAVQGSIAVTGWVLDDVGVSKVEIFNGDSYVGDATFVDGARPDVEAAFPGYPQNSSAGWGYMLLTNFLPDGGNGTYTLVAKATDAEGNKVVLGSTTITCDNAHAVKPFGAIDTPGQGGTASGSNFVIFGWALTPRPSTIPVDGSTINIWIDGVNIGHPAYNVYRSDIATLFPNYNNSNGAIGYYYLDTTAYSTGVHTIQWTVTDNAGNTDGIGSRYFTVLNTGSDVAKRVLPRSQAIREGALSSIENGNTKSKANGGGSVFVKKGYSAKDFVQRIYPDRRGVLHIQIRELEPIEIHFPVGSGMSSCNFSSIMRISKLPVGSTFDVEKGIFYWMPGPGFYGNYSFELDGVFDGSVKKISVTILPRFSKK